MAKKGFLYVVAGKLSEDETSYTDGCYMGPSSTFNINPTSNDVKDYGDNGVTETDTSVTGGTASLEINEFTNENYAYVLGHTYDKEKDAVVCKKEDIAPFIGLGAVGVSKRNNAHKYTAKFYRKLQFKEPNDENATQQDTVSFTHTTLEGNVFVPEDGQWKEQQTFDTLKEAKEYLNKKVGITTSTAGDVTGK